MHSNKFLKGRSGIYGIRNIVNGKLYVGQTRCMYRRCHQYIYDFKTSRRGHLNDYLRNAMNKAGIDSFEFFPLEFCDVSSLMSRELYWITEFDTVNKLKGYNLRTDTSTGMSASIETRLKISANLKDQWQAGVRDGHSGKMKKNWRSNSQRREQQSTLMSKTKTKYEYAVTGEDGKTVSNMTYAELRIFGLKNVIASFHRKKSNSVMYRGFKIERSALGEA